MNYFKIGKDAFFFRDQDVSSIARAWDAARAVQEAKPNVPIAVWQVPMVRGPWSDVVQPVGESMGPKSIEEI